MELSGELREVHRDLSEHDLRFRELALARPEMRRRRTFRVLGEHPELLAFNIQSWPTFVRRGKIEELAHAALGISRLIKSLPERVFGNDPARVAEFYRLGSPFLAELVLAPPDGRETAMSRGDFIDTAAGFRCIEFNFVPQLGGWETSILAALNLQIPETAAFLEGLSYRATNTLRLLFRHIVDDVLAKGLCPGGPEEEVHIVLLLQPGRPQGMREIGAWFQRELTAAAGEAGLSGAALHLVCPADLAFRKGRVYVGENRIHALIEHTGEASPPQVFRSFKTRRLALYNGPINRVLSNKRNIALLSEHADSELFPPEDRELIRAHVPWTRRVVPGPVGFRGERVDLADLLASQRRELVLKESANFGGKGVSLGRFTPAAEWDEVARLAFAAGDWVVQEHLESRPLLCQAGEEGCSPHDVIWGPFVFGSTYAGAILRMQPKADGGAVNLSLTATEGLILEV